MKRRDRACACLVSLLVACGSRESDSGSSDGGSTSVETSVGDTSAAPGTSSGGLPDACPDVALETGLVGRTDRRSCDTDGDCVMPVAGVALAVYGSNPQVGGSATEAGTLDPAAVAIDTLSTGVGGRFEFQLPAGTYHVCATEPSDMVLCSAAIVLTATDPVMFAVYETGNGSSWSVISCST